MLVAALPVITLGYIAALYLDEGTELIVLQALGSQAGSILPRMEPVVRVGL